MFNLLERGYSLKYCFGHIYNFEIEMSNIRLFWHILMEKE